MRLLLVAAVVAWSCGAHADVPNGIAQRLVRFMFEGCDYLSANSPEPHQPEPPDKKLAAHFGRIVKTQKRGIGLEYVLKTSTFAGWDVTYWFRGIDLKPPPTVAITMGDLQKLLGADDSPDVDYAVSATASGTKIAVEDRVFDLHREDACRVEVRAEADEKKGPERRVFSLRFWN